MGKKLIIFAPHPDDELLSCGGTILKNLEAKNEIKIILINGDNALRVKEFENCMEALGIEDYENWDYKSDDFRVEGESIKRITKLIVDYKPDKIYCPVRHWEIHRLHRRVGKAVIEAAYHAKTGAYTGESHLTEVYLYETASWVFDNNEELELVDISNYINKKIQIFFTHYESQLKLKEWIKKMGKKRGEQKGCEYAEAFKKFPMERLG